jgi:hypothetical protein
MELEQLIHERSYVVHTLASALPADPDPASAGGRGAGLAPPPSRSSASA